MSAALTRLRDARFIRYLLASASALALDMGVFIALLAAGLAAAAASAIGYAIGIAAHWLLSSRAVFTGHVATSGARRTWQKTLFVMSALIGLGLTTAIVGIGAALGLDPRLAKLAAIGVSFLATWLMRSEIVFRAREAAA